MNIFRKIKLKLIYWTTKQLGCENVGGHYVKVSHITAGGKILDLGANRGVFSIEMHKKFRTVSVCVEPNKVLFDKLDCGNWGIKIYGAVSDQDGEIAFKISNNHEASSIYDSIASVWSITKTESVPAYTLKSLLKRIGNDDIELIKIDIEGAEVNLIKSTDDALLCKFPQIAIEFHEFLSSQFLEDTKLIINRLRNLGFRMIVTSSDKYSEVLFINKRNVQFTLTERFWYVCHRLICYS